MLGGPSSPFFFQARPSLGAAQGLHSCQELCVRCFSPNGDGQCFMKLFYCLAVLSGLLSRHLWAHKLWLSPATCFLHWSQYLSCPAVG